MRPFIAIIASFALAAPLAAQPKPTRTSDEIVDQLVGGEKAFSLATTGNKPQPAQAARPTATPSRAAPKRTTAARPAANALDMRVSFGLGSADLTDQARIEAREFARALQSPRLSGMRFRVDGHTDAIGNRDYNLDLSKRRADSVVAFLVAEGVEPTRLVAQGYGFDRPRQSLAPKDARNRRVEFAPAQ